MQTRQVRKTANNPLFTPAEISQLWEAKDTNDYYTIALMFLYTGCRVSELLDLKKEDVDIPGRCFKIIAGKTGMRMVPIAEKVVPLFEYWYNLNNCEYLLSTPEGCHIDNTMYRVRYWAPLMKALNAKYKPHDTRHTFRQLLYSAGVPHRIVCSIVGHACLEGANMEEMIDAINKI